MMVTSLIPLSQEATAKKHKDCYKILFLVNIVKNSGFDEDDVKEGIKAANKVLKKICVKTYANKGFKKLDHNGPDIDVFGIPTKNDGKVGVGEIGKWVKAGEEEVKKYQKSKKKKLGYVPIKLWVVNDTIDINVGGIPPKTESGKGAAREGVPVIFVSYIKGLTNEELGITIAHELAHKIGLEHTNFTDNDTEDDKESNVMNYFTNFKKFLEDNNIDDVTWSKIQKEIIKQKKWLEQEGKKVPRIAYNPPEQKSERQYAAVVDDIGDQITGKGKIFDINQVEIMSDVKYDDVSIYLALAEPLSTSEQTDVVTSVLFDSDGDSTTGMTLEGFEGGYDSEARIEVSKINQKSLCKLLALYMIGTNQLLKN